MDSSKKNEKPPSRGEQELRRRAEGCVQAGGGSPVEDWEAARLIHELQVHQVELEMQNEELRSMQQAAEAARNRYFDLYNLAPVGYFTLNAGTKILEVNQSGARLLGVARPSLLGWGMLGFIEAEDQIVWMRHLAAAWANPEPQGCELNIRRSDGTQFAARIDSVRNSSLTTTEPAKTLLVAISDISELRRAEQERAAQAEHFSEMAWHLAQVQEDERKQLSGEIHDRTSPNLAALKLTLATLAQTVPESQQQNVAELLADATALIDDTMASLREISSELRPPILDYAGLLPAIESAADRFARRTGIKTTIDASRFAERSTREHETALFRIFNEALANCAKHAAAKAMHVVLANDGPQTVLTVSDDGVGFDVDRQAQLSQPHGLGLLIMKERAEFAGGKFRIDSAPGRGTRIEVRI